MKGWLADAHGVTPGQLGLVGAGWMVAVAAARLGIPRVDPALEATARPLETLGFVAVLLPASLLAGMLADEAPWLTLTAGRDARGLRLRWGMVLAASALVMGLAWAATLPASVPRVHSLAAWLLVVGLATWSSVLVRADLAIVVPALVVVPLSVGRLVPFDVNILYNVDLAGPAVWAAVAAFGSGLTGYVLLGDARARRGE